MQHPELQRPRTASLIPSGLRWLCSHGSCHVW